MSPTAGEARPPTTSSTRSSRCARGAEAEAFFRDLCTLGELRDMTQRWQVVRLLEQGRHYAEISRETGASTATITRIAAWLRHGAGGYRLALARRPTADLRPR